MSAGLSQLVQSDSAGAVRQHARFGRRPLRPREPASRQRIHLALVSGPATPIGARRYDRAGIAAASGRATLGEGGLLIGDGFGSVCECIGTSDRGSDDQADDAEHD